LEAKVNEYLSFVMRLIFAFGISFELPVLLTLLANVGMVSSQGLIAKWRFAVVGIFVVAAIITPPDMLSMIGLAIPLVILYGLSILMVRWVEYKRI
jgi:sec-independent protein translocase protein TatC